MSMFTHEMIREWMGGQNVLGNGHKMMEFATVLLYCKFFFTLCYKRLTQAWVILMLRKIIIKQV